MRSGNPALGEKTFERFRGAEATNVMTVGGTAFKCAVLLVLCLAGAFWSWRTFFTAETLQAGAAAIQPWMWGGMIGGFIVALIIIFVPRMSPFLSPVYVVLEGLFLGGLSAFVETVYPGIAIQAVGLTFGVFLTMLTVYATRLVRVTQNFRMGVVAATGGIFLVYMASWILGIFGVAIPYIHEGGIIGIGFSLFVVIVAALNLVLDFDFIEHGAEAGAPRYMEWYGAFGMMITLVWLYIEILHLLMKLRGGDE